MAYMPDHDVGYFYSINSSNGDAFYRIGKGIRDYVTRNLERPALPAVASLPLQAADYAGWYEVDTPRVEMTHFLDRLAIIAWIHFKDGKLLFSYPGGWNDTFVPVTGTQFRHVPKNKDELPDPVAVLELLTPNEEGRFVEAGVTMKKIPGWFAIGEILTVVYVILCMISVLMYAPFWVLGGLSRRRRRPTERGMRVWPLIAVVSLVASVGVCIMSSNDLIGRFGNVTGWSVALFLLTIVYAVAAVASALSLWRAGRGSAPERAQVFASRDRSPADRDGLPRVLGHHWPASVGMKDFCSLPNCCNQRLRLEPGLATKVSNSCNLCIRARCIGQKIER
jgi:hypothetical protein